MTEALPAEKASVRSPEAYRALLDPEGTLPKVTLKKLEATDPTAPQAQWDNLQIYTADGVLVGRLLLSKGTEPKTAFISDVFAEKHHGYGRAAYLALIELLAKDGIRLVSGHTLSRDALPIWQWMVAQGAARLVEGRGVNERVVNMHYTTSRYEII